MDKKRALEILKSKKSFIELKEHVNTYHKPVFCCAPMGFGDPSDRYFNAPAQGPTSRLIVSKTSKWMTVLDRGVANTNVRSKGWSMITKSVLNPMRSEVVEILNAIEREENK